MHPAIFILHEGETERTILKLIYCILRGNCNFYFLLQDETDVIFHMKAYESRSVLLRNINPSTLLRILDRQLSLGVQGILQDIVR